MKVVVTLAGRDPIEIDQSAIYPVFTAGGDLLIYVSLSAGASYDLFTGYSRTTQPTFEVAKFPAGSRRDRWRSIMDHLTKTHAAPPDPRKG